ncbi:alkene reductase [Sulfurirhabdus autotrophica]|uniref:N-ethylmaleimide reductase n=1 Tax=Sulfurirhabdus autotrophica TaxID=1706046 RepID=A0A4R3XSM8_9PROT|nr:alkene reductase [Sulfurirhabdus autotrophica]TCV80231.1 N-ethylmaleimide reductase [Sulfurirhabdus autotrophica]
MHIDLFTPFNMGPYTLPNRLVMAPLTRNRAGAGNAPQPLNVEYYRQRASAGLIISEGSQISAGAVGYPATPGIHSTEQIAGWKQVTEAVHHSGGRIFLQLWHCGRISHPSMLPGNALPVAPSAIKPEGQAVTYQGMQEFVTPRALEAAELSGIVDEFRTAAQNALDACFDGVEIHAANGYLLDQFIRDGSNQRTDNYGGTPENRCRLLKEVTEAVTNVWGANRVGVRLSPLNPFNDMHDSNPQHTFETAAKTLSPFGLAYLHIMETAIGENKHPKQDFDFHKLRLAYNGTYMANGGYDKVRAERALASGYADLIAFGVLFLANPDLPERIRQNTPLNTPNQATFYGGDEKGYTDYPALG